VVNMTETSSPAPRRWHPASDLDRASQAPSSGGREGLGDAGSSANATPGPVSHSL
jgi:hypothetical protein